MDFTAIDFETANGFRGSPCAVGLSKVRGGVVVEEASWLMRPPENHDRFDYHNVRIHGSRPEDVAGRPRFGELFPEIGAFIGGDVLAAHNAAFDLGVIRSGLEVSGLPGPAGDTEMPRSRSASIIGTDTKSKSTAMPRQRNAGKRAPCHTRRSFSRVFSTISKPRRLPIVSNCAGSPIISAVKAYGRPVAKRSFTTWRVFARDKNHENDIASVG